MADFDDGNDRDKTYDVAPYLVFVACAGVAAWAANMMTIRGGREATPLAVFFALAAVVLPIVMAIRRSGGR